LKGSRLAHSRSFVLSYVQILKGESGTSSAN
jgi:hypothetical protein